MPDRSPLFSPLPELRRRCRRLARAAKDYTLDGHRLTIHDIRIHQKREGKATLEHVHSFYEGHVLLSGVGRYAMGEPQTLRPGGALLHGPHTPHAWAASDVSCVRLLVWFGLEPTIPAPRPAAWPEWPDLLWDLSLLFADAAATAPGWQTRVTARLSVVFSRLLTIINWPSTPQPVREPQPHLVTMVDQFLQDNLARPLTLDDIADHVSISQRTLCRQFQHRTGATVMERLETLRMDRAAALLAETEATLKEIAEAIGMTDASYFCRRFRQHYHVTPNTYRQDVGARARREERTTTV
ncbi:MAG TPA: AraC family transcriptional regulator [Armatimonadota bacterium]|nr:AraC family transcriptional regulator [Armatimonadota bacterium]HOS42525.1 AraC family transcriptional regulator [Armatimonadota bacterium]